MGTYSKVAPGKWNIDGVIQALKRHAARDLVFESKHPESEDKAAILGFPNTRRPGFSLNANLGAKSTPEEAGAVRRTAFERDSRILHLVFTNQNLVTENTKDLKGAQYRALVQKRKQCRLCDGVINCSRFPQDSDEIGPWSLWHSDLNAEIMVVGQDWGTVLYFEKWDGRDEPINETNAELILGMNLARIASLTVFQEIEHKMKKNCRNVG